MSGTGGGSVESVLRAAGIRGDRCGSARGAGLGDAEREVYRWLLRRFAEQGRPSGRVVEERAVELGLDPAATLERLAALDLVHRGADGEIAVAYPFSGWVLR